MVNSHLPLGEGGGLLTIYHLLLTLLARQAEPVELGGKLGDEQVGVLEEAGFQGVHSDDPGGGSIYNDRHSGVGSQLKGFGPLVNL